MKKSLTLVAAAIFALSTMAVAQNATPKAEAKPVEAAKPAAKPATEKPAAKPGKETPAAKPATAKPEAAPAGGQKAEPAHKPN